MYKECDDPCCNATTCTLAAGAQCTRGECCSNECQFEAMGTTCRNASGECDIEEYCSGKSSECPEDLYLQDSSPCNNKQSYCFSGVCKTYDDQCQYHFRSSEHNVLVDGWTDIAMHLHWLLFTDKGVDECFSVLNTRGDFYGNCGSDGTNFVGCAPRYRY